MWAKDLDSASLGELRFVPETAALFDYSTISGSVLESSNLFIKIFLKFSYFLHEV